MPTISNPQAWLVVTSDTTPLHQLTRATRLVTLKIGRRRSLVNTLRKINYLKELVAVECMNS
jgi:hypothetical protein